jgi:hypothetical protein
MPAVVDCPACGGKLKVPDELMGKEVRCADCAGRFLAEQPKPTIPPPSSELVPARSSNRDDGDDYDDDRPRRRSLRRTGDWEPHRGGMILAFGIMAIVLGGVGLVTGILAWIWGGQDLKKIDAGRMDPEGRSMTQIGYILGIVGTILHTIGLIFVCLYFVFIFVIMAFFVGAAASLPTTRMGTVPPQKPFNPGRKNWFMLPMRAVDYLPQRIG